jgi:DNA polymerase III subunit epsilon
MGRFVAIDFETANNRSNSACQIGAVWVEDWKIVHEQVWLIRPPRMYFSPMCVSVHGITPRDCMESPGWDRVWAELQPAVEGQLIVGHNVGFDANVLLGCNQHYDIAISELEIQCTRLIAKRAWPSNDGHGLAKITQHLGILFKHHDALEDARACAWVAIHAAEKLNAKSMEELEESLGLVRGKVRSDIVRNPRTIRQRRTDRIEEPSGRIEPKQFRIDGIPRRAAAKRPNLVVDSILQSCRNEKPLANKKMVLVNTILNLERQDAIDFLTTLGAIVQANVNMQTQFVVLGAPTQPTQQRYLFQELELSVEEENGESPSERAVEEVAKRRELGQPIYLLSPRQLMAMIPAAAAIVRGE